MSMDDGTRLLCLAATMRAAASVASKGRWCHLDDVIITDGITDNHPGDTTGYGGPLVCESITQKDALFLMAAQPQHIVEVLEEFARVARELKHIKQVLGDHRDSIVHASESAEDAVERLNSILKGLL